MPPDRQGVPSGARPRKPPPPASRSPAMTAADAPPRPRRRRRWPFYLVGLLVLLVVLWLGYWFAATRVAVAAVARVTSAPVAGFTIGCPNAGVDGFPLRVD